MTARYVEIRYTDAVERVPLHHPDELRGILERRGSYVDYSIHTSFWYGVVPWRRRQVVYTPQAARGRDNR